MHVGSSPVLLSVSPGPLPPLNGEGRLVRSTSGVG
jgi:hypothetical protein